MARRPDSVRASNKLATRSSKTVVVKGHEVAVRTRNFHSRVTPGKATWWRPPDLELRYESKVRTASGGGFSEEELREMEKKYGAPIKLKAPPAEASGAENPPKAKPSGRS